MEIAIIGSDIQEIVGTATALNLILGVKLWIGCLITFVDTMVFFCLHLAGIRKLEAFVAALVFTIAICFWAEWGLADTNGGEILEAFVAALVFTIAICFW